MSQGQSSVIALDVGASISTEGGAGGGAAPLPPSLPLVSALFIEHRCCVEHFYITF